MDLFEPIFFFGSQCGISRYQVGRNSGIWMNERMEKDVWMVKSEIKKVQMSIEWERKVVDLKARKWDQRNFLRETNLRLVWATFE